jgi:hypothetical protein
MEAITKEGCTAAGAELCAKGGDGSTFMGANANRCCRTLGVNDFAMCRSDDDCLVDSGQGYLQDTQVVKVEQQCCSYCAGLFDLAGDQAFCSGAPDEAGLQYCDAAVGVCAADDAVTGCYGYPFAFVSAIIDTEKGGSARTASGSGITVPAGVWPPSAGPATITMVEEPPEPAKDGSKPAGPAVFFGPTGTVFPEPGVQLALPFESSGSPDVELRVFKLVQGEWKLHPFKPAVDPATGELSCKTLSFSQYAVFEVAVVVQANTTTTAAPVVTTTPEPIQAPPEGTLPAPVIGTTPYVEPFTIAASTGIIAGALVGVTLVLCCVVVVFVRRRSAHQRLAALKYKVQDTSKIENLLTQKAPKAPSRVGSISDRASQLLASVRARQSGLRNLQPQFYEVEPSLLIQSDLVMADGSAPPSYANSEIAREDAEEMILMGQYGAASITTDSSPYETADPSPRTDLYPPQPPKAAVVDPGRDFPSSAASSKAPVATISARKMVHEAERLRTKVSVGYPAAPAVQPSLEAHGVALQADMVMFGEAEPERYSPAPSFAATSHTATSDGEDDDMPTVLKPSMHAGVLDDQDDII